MNGFKPHPGSQFADLPCCCASRPSTYLTTPPSHGFHKGSKGWSAVFTASGRTRISLVVIALRIRRASDAMINRSQSDTRILFSNGAGKWMHYPQGGPRRARITYTHTRDPYPWTRQGPPRWAGAPLGRLKSPGQNLPVGTAQDSLKALPQCVRRPALPCRNWKLFAALDLPFPFVPVACYHQRAGLPSKFHPRRIDSGQG